MHYTEKYVALVKTDTIAAHREAWNLLLGLTEDEILACFTALQNSDYKNWHRFVEGYVENDNGKLHSAASAYLKEK